jgi:hypothetical protein
MTPLALPHSPDSRWGRFELLSLCLVVVLIGLMLASLTLGRYPLSLREIVQAVFSSVPFGAIGDYTDESSVITTIIRMPRILLVTICGMGLALAGATRPYRKFEARYDVRMMPQSDLAPARPWCRIKNWPLNCRAIFM